MGIFETLRSNRSSFGQNRDDLIQFVAGAAFGIMFLTWTFWTWHLIVAG